MTMVRDLRLPESTISRIWTSLESKGYALTSDEELGVDPQFRKHVQHSYFDAGEVRRPITDMPPDRDRARDVLRYEWRGEEDLRLSEHHTTALVNRGDQAGTREYHRVLVLDDDQFTDWVHRVLHLVPPQRRRPSGTFGVNLFRTRTRVVTKPHRDDEELIVTYVVGRHGEGAESVLIDPVSTAEVLRTQLQPGELLIFSDARFLHSVTPLVPAVDGAAVRDALVCTVDYPRPEGA